MIAHDGLEKVGTSVNPLTTGIDVLPGSLFLFLHFVLPGSS